MMFVYYITEFTLLIIDLLIKITLYDYYYYNKIMLLKLSSDSGSRLLFKYYFF